MIRVKGERSRSGKLQVRTGPGDGRFCGGGVSAGVTPVSSNSGILGLIPVCFGWKRGFSVRRGAQIRRAEGY